MPWHLTWVKAVSLSISAAAALTVIGLEIRDDGVLRRLGAALDGAHASFVGGRPELCTI